MKQTIPTHTLTPITGKPGMAAYHEFGRTAWLEVREDGGLTLSESPIGSDWQIYMNSGGTLEPLPEPAFTVDWR